MYVRSGGKRITANQVAVFKEFTKGVNDHLEAIGKEEDKQKAAEPVGRVFESRYEEYTKVRSYN